MTQEEIASYAGKVFGFCLRRLGNVEDARDLSQDILCEALASMNKKPLEHPEAWLWGVARNCLCRFLRKKPSGMVSLDADDLIQTIVQPEQEDLSQEANAAFTALHTLAASHREIMVDYYVSGLTCAQIAAKRGLPSETVRSRLFYGRDKLRKRWQMKMTENRIYQRNEWFITGNGDVNTSLLSRQIVRSILAACSSQFQSIDDLSLATGIPAMYIEDELKPLVDAGALECQNSRCRTGMIIHQEAFSKKAEAFLLEHARRLAPVLSKELDQLLPKLRSVGFHGCDLPEERLCWTVIPMLMREAITMARSNHPELVRGDFPLRADGSRGWLCAYLEPEHSYFSGCNAYFRDGSRFRYYWSHDLFSEGLNRLLKKLENERITDASVSLPEDLLAECIRYDLIIRKGDLFEWNIPVFTKEEIQTFAEFLHASAGRLREQLLPAVNGLYEMMRREIPAHLHDQIRGVFGIECNTIIAMLCELLLLKPECDPFAGQIVMLLDAPAALPL